VLNTQSLALEPRKNKTHRHTDTQTHRLTERDKSQTQTHRHTDTQTHRHSDTQTQTQTLTEQDKSKHMHTWCLCKCVLTAQGKSRPASYSLAGLLTPPGLLTTYSFNLVLRRPTNATRPIGRNFTDLIVASSSLCHPLSPRPLPLLFLDFSLSLSTCRARCCHSICLPCAHASR